MKKRISTYLAIALTTDCNYRCFYCKEGGESCSKEKGTIPLDKLKTIISNAYEIGIRNFRITGGEPTTVSYIDELIIYIMNFDNTRIRINTNGYKILDYIDVLVQYRDRLDIVFSVDSISEYLNGVHFPKFLSEDVINITRLLTKNEIPVRYNIVVTTLNEQEIEELVLKAIDELQVNVKLLDLNKFSEYLGYSGILTGKDGLSLWEKLFIPMERFYNFLNNISNDSKINWTTQLIGNGHGIPMNTYFRGENWIQVKDSCKRANYSDFCMKNCVFYENGNCQEGVFSLFLSSNLTLHWSGCKNSSIHFDLNNCDDEQTKNAFLELLKLM